MTTQQAYIEGFVKRANEYGYNRNEAISLLRQVDEYGASENSIAKQAFLGEPAYKDIPDLSEEELKALSYSDLKKHLEPQKGEGALAHLKRHLGSYALGGAGALVGGSVVNHLSGGDDGSAAIAALLGGAAGGTLGAAPDALINLVRKHTVSAKGEKELNRLSRHTHARNSLNSPSQTNYNKHSL